MAERECIHVWPGERRLLPTGDQHRIYELRCLKGKGYIRLMSQSHRDLFVQSSLLVVPGGETVTVSAEGKMVIEVTATGKVLE